MAWTEIHHFWMNTDSSDWKVNGPMNLLLDMLRESWHLLLDASVYILFGLLVSGLFRVFLNPDTIGRHLGTGRFASVFKAALIGVPIPL